MERINEENLDKQLSIDSGQNYQIGRPRIRTGDSD